MRKNLLSEDYLSCREVSPAAAAVVLQKRLGFSIWYVVSIHFSWREDMKHETRMARLGVRSTSSTHHIHLDDYTHTSYNVNFGESFLTISNLYTTFLVQHKVLLLYIAADIWCTSYDETKFSKVHQKNVQKLDQLIFILYRGLPIHIRPDDYLYFVRLKNRIYCYQTY